MISRRRIHRPLRPAFVASAMLVTVALSSACVGGGRAEPGLSTSVHPGGDGSVAVEVLTSAQLGASGPGRSLYEALEHLRPELLHWRDPAGGKPDGALPVVYIDGARISDAQRLRSIPCDRVRKVQILSRDLATRRYGGGHEAGAILVSLVPDSQ